MFLQIQSAVGLASVYCHCYCSAVTLIRKNLITTENISLGKEHNIDAVCLITAIKSIFNFIALN